MMDQNCLMDSISPITIIRAIFNISEADVLDIREMDENQNGLVLPSNIYADLCSLKKKTRSKTQSLNGVL